jgi:hypothetical protein
LDAGKGSTPAAEQDKHVDAEGKVDAMSMGSKKTCMDKAI